MPLLQPPAILLEGSPGAGKTFAIPTFCKAGIETFVIMTEPGGVESLLDGAKYHKIDMEKLHWTTVAPTPAGWDAMDAMVKQISFQSYEDLTKIKSGIGKEQTRQTMINFLGQLKNFRDERTGKEYGDFTSWDDTKALVIDSLSGLNTIIWTLTLGFKPAAHQGEWGVAMNALETLLLKVTSDRSCFLAVTAHIEKETNELTGVSQVMVSTLGRKLAPKIPRFFSEVVLAKRTKDMGFRWSTLENNADLKNRALPVSDNINPDFSQVVDSYRSRVKLAGATSPSPASDAIKAA